MTAIEDDLTRVLEANGITAIAPDGMHSWRCEYPDMYGPCDCLAELVAVLAPIVAAHVATGQEQAWNEGMRAGHDCTGAKLDGLCAIRQPNPYGDTQIGQGGDEEPCDEELHSWDYFTSQQVDSYWMRCSLAGQHDEHENADTGATWKTENRAATYTTTKETS